MDSVPPGVPEDEAFEFEVEGEVEIPAKWQTVATYELELPAKCPHCRAPIRTLKVLRLNRSKVSFISTLPRTGRAIVCPGCEAIISVDISGLI